MDPHNIDPSSDNIISLDPNVDPSVERVVGQFTPNRNALKSLSRQKFGIALVQVTLMTVPSVILPAISIGRISLHVFELIIISLVIVSLASVLPQWFSIRSISRTVYVVTEKRAIIAASLGRKIKKEFPMNEIERAVMINSPLQTINYYAVFFPANGYLDLNGLYTNLPVSISLLARIQNIDKKEHGEKPKLRHIFASARKISKQVRKRSFLYLSEQDAVKIVNLFQSIKTGKKVIG